MRQSLTPLAPAPLVAKDLVKTYAGRPVVNGIDLCLEPGEVTALIGRSGAGKTTLLRLLAGMERPDSGSLTSGAEILSDTITFLPPEQRRIGLIFQDFALFPHLDVVRNIAFGLGHLPKQERLDEAAEWLKSLDLDARGRAYPHQLSGGEQQRVAIARALAPKPVAILMDEPFSGLDPVLREQARTVALNAVRTSRTPALMVTHHANEALAHADQIAVMSAGKLLQVSSPGDIYANPNSLIVAQALGHVQSIDKTLLPKAWQAHLPDATILYMRPEAIQIDPSSDVSMKIQNVQRLGTLTKITFAETNALLNASVITRDPPQAGATVPVSIDPACVFAFPK